VLVTTYLHSLDWYSVLKSTGSSFADFVRDEYTTLAEVDDRVFSTSVDLSYTYSPFAIRFPADAKKLAFEVPREVADAEGVAMKARVATLDIFATDESESVQVSHAESKIVVVLMVLAGDPVQDGATSRRGERSRGDGVVQASQQALRRCGYEVHWGGQHDAVSDQLFFCGPTLR